MYYRYSTTLYLTDFLDELSAAAPIAKLLCVDNGSNPFERRCSSEAYEQPLHIEAKGEHHTGCPIPWLGIPLSPSLARLRHLPYQLHIVQSDPDIAILANGLKTVL